LPYKNAKTFCVWGILFSQLILMKEGFMRRDGPRRRKDAKRSFLFASSWRLCMKLPQRPGVLIFFPITSKKNFSKKKLDPVHKFRNAMPHYTSKIMHRFFPQVGDISQSEISKRKNTFVLPLR